MPFRKAWHHNCGRKIPRLVSVLIIPAWSKADGLLRNGSMDDALGFQLSELGGWGGEWGGEAGREGEKQPVWGPEEAS